MTHSDSLRTRALSLMTQEARNALVDWLKAESVDALARSQDTLSGPETRLEEVAISDQIDILAEIVKSHK